MDFLDLVTRTRSYRRFQQTPVARTTLRALVNLARLSPTGGNLQPLKFFLSHDAATNDAIFPCTAWAGYLTGWGGPAEGERPMAYILICTDTRIKPEAHHDVGIAAQSIVLGAMEKGLGACMIGSIRQRELRTALRVPDALQVSLVIALGVPGETVALENLGADGGIKYYRDAAGVHHVPKRSLDDLIVEF